MSLLKYIDALPSIKSRLDELTINDTPSSKEFNIAQIELPEELSKPYPPDLVEKERIDNEYMEMKNYLNEVFQSKLSAINYVKDYMKQQEESLQLARSIELEEMQKSFKQVPLSKVPFCNDTYLTFDDEVLGSIGLRGWKPSSRILSHFPNFEESAESADNKSVDKEEKFVQSKVKSIKKRRPQTSSTNVVELQTDYLRNPRFHPEDVKDFESSPSLIEFNDYEPHKTYSNKFQIKNISKNLKKIRISCSESEDFHMELHGKKLGYFLGEMAPGIIIEMNLVFRPSFASPYEHNIVVESESGFKFNIPIKAERTRANLIKDPVFDMGVSLYGCDKEREFTIKNTGGRLKFLLVRPGETGYNVKTDKASITNKFYDSEGPKELKVGAFKIFPIAFTLDRNEEISIKVRFSPKQDDVLQNTEYYKSITLNEISDVQHEVHLQLLGEDFTLFDFDLSGIAQYPQIFFDSECYSVSQSVTFNRYEESKVIQIKNQNATELHYQWLFEDDDEKDKGYQLVASSNREYELYDSSMTKVKYDNSVFRISHVQGVLKADEVISVKIKFKPNITLDRTSYEFTGRMIITSQEDEPIRNFKRGYVDSGLSLTLRGSFVMKQVAKFPPFIDNVNDGYHTLIDFNQLFRKKTEDTDWITFVENSRKLQAKVSTLKIDFGLLKPMQRRMQTFVLSNTSEDQMMNWKLKTVLKDDGVLEYTDLEYLDLEGFDFLVDTLEYQHPGCFVLITPCDSGTLKPNDFITIYVEFIPTRVRDFYGFIEVHEDVQRVDYFPVVGQSHPSQVVNFNALVHYPRASLEESTIDLGVLYEGTIVTTTITLRNETGFVTDFKFVDTKQLTVYPSEGKIAPASTIDILLTFEVEKQTQFEQSYSIDIDNGRQILDFSILAQVQGFQIELEYPKVKVEEKGHALQHSEAFGKDSIGLSSMKQHSAADILKPDRTPKSSRKGNKSLGKSNELLPVLKKELSRLKLLIPNECVDLGEELSLFQLYKIRVYVKNVTAINKQLRFKIHSLRGISFTNAEDVIDIAAFSTSELQLEYTVETPGEYLSVLEFVDVEKRISLYATAKGSGIGFVSIKTIGLSMEDKSAQIPSISLARGYPAFSKASISFGTHVALKTRIDRKVWIRNATTMPVLLKQVKACEDFGFPTEIRLGAKEEKAVDVWFYRESVGSSLFKYEYQCSFEYPSFEHPGAIAASYAEFESLFLSCYGGVTFREESLTIGDELLQ